ncbi:hypothetical protein EDD25_3505 [Cryobacterium psychrophilum]|nr:hypothetical protein EDD25_3505 [Cryobacterium psychrophilum]
MAAIRKSRIHAAHNHSIELNLSIPVRGSSSDTIAAGNLCNYAAIYF